MVSWIMDKDFCEILDLFLNDKECKGIYNMASPNPIKNKDMMALFRKNFCSNSNKYSRSIMAHRNWLLFYENRKRACY